MSLHGKGHTEQFFVQKSMEHGAGAPMLKKHREMVERLQKRISQEPALGAKMLERFLKGDE